MNIVEINKSNNLNTIESDKIYSLILNNDTTIMSGYINNDSMYIHKSLKVIGDISLTKDIKINNTNITKNGKLVLSSLSDENCKHGQVLTFDNKWQSKDLFKNVYIKASDFENEYTTNLDTDIKLNIIKFPNETYQINHIIPCPYDLNDSNVFINLFWYNPINMIFGNTLKLNVSMIDNLDHIEKIYTIVKSTSHPNYINSTDYNKVPISNYSKDFKNKLLLITLERDMSPKYNNSSTNNFNFIGMNIKYNILI